MHTNVIFPPSLESAIQGAATSLGNALRTLEYPNKGRDAPCHEVNAVINVAMQLSRVDPPFQLYAEGTTEERGRVDLIGFNGVTAFALEAKAFGRINFKSEEVLNDWDRLKNFEPQMSEVAGNFEARRWWQEAESRWRIIVITSFRGGEIARAWQSPDEDEFARQMSGYAKHEQARTAAGGAQGFLKLYQAISSHPHGAFEICKGERWGGGDAWLLWAAEALPP